MIAVCNCSFWVPGSRGGGGNEEDIDAVKEQYS